MTELEKYIKSYLGIGDEELHKISSFFQPLALKRGEFFLKTGRRSNRLGFLRSGNMREFTHKKDKEITKWISTNGYFITDLASFIFKHEARWNIQALTDCELYVIDDADYKRIDEIIPQWAELEKLFIVRCFCVLEDRIITHLSMTAEERYKQLYHFNPDLFNTVPLQYLASMLGITAETLSRLRSKNLKTNS